MNERDREKLTNKNSSRRRSRSRSPIESQLDYKKFMVLENLEKGITWNKVKQIIINNFGGNAPAPSEIFVAPVGQNRVIVRFSDTDICQNAVKVMNGKQIRGNIIKAALDNDCQYKKVQWNEIGRKQFSSVKVKVPPRFAEGRETYGLSVSLLRDLDIRVIKKTIFVSNLDPSIKEEKLREIFHMAGEVICLHVARKPEMTSAKIQFSHPLEAVQAISMFHNKELNGRNLIVRMDISKQKALPEGLNKLGPGLGPNGAPLRHFHTMQEIESLKKMFTNEIEELKKTIEKLSANLAAQSQKFNSEYKKETPIQNSSTVRHSNKSQDAPITTPIVSPISLNMPDTNMKHMYHPNNQMMGQVDLMSRQLNTLPINPAPVIFGQTGYMGPINPVDQFQGQMANQMGHMTNHIGSVATQMSHNDYTNTQMNYTAGQGVFLQGQMNQTPGQMNQIPGQMNQVPGQMSQVPGPMAHLSHNDYANTQMNYTTGQAVHSQGQMNQVPGQMNQVPGQMNQVPGQMSQVPGQMCQVPGQMNQALGQMSQIPGQMNQVPGQMNQVPGQMNQMPGQMNQVPGQMSQVPGQMNQGPGQMNQVPGQINQVPGQMSQVPVQMNQVPGQMNQVPGQINQVPGQMSQIPGQMNQVPGQISQVPAPISSTDQAGHISNQTSYMSDQMSQVSSGQRGQMNKTPDQPIRFQIKSDKSKDQGHRSKDLSNKSYEDKRSENSRSSSKEPKKTDMLLFSNLPSTVSQSVLSSKLRELGELKFAEMTGNGKAIVRFQNERTAKRCIDLFHLSKVDGEVIDVTYL